MGELERGQEQEVGTSDLRLSSVHFSLPTPDKREYGQVVALL